MKFMEDKIVTFGEILMRLSPSNHKTIQQSKDIEFFFGGTELNVGASLSTFGCSVEHVSAVSDDFIGDAAISYVKKFGINTNSIQRNNQPLGLYFLEVGTELRPSRISYNRLNGSFANIDTQRVDWAKILKNKTHFHWTGITPGISKNAYQTLKDGLIEANHHGIEISTDPAYRSNLWQYGKEGRVILKDLVALSTIFIGGVNEINEILGTSFTHKTEDFIAASKRLMKEIPSIKHVFDKIRIAPTANKQMIQGRAWSENNYIETNEISIENAIDRIGTGDAFAAGLIYGLNHFNTQEALTFANTACAIKHTYLGDINLATKEDILEIMNGNLGGRIKR